MLQTFYAERIHIGLNQVKNKSDVSNEWIHVFYLLLNKKK